jgi:hypothetical protein
MAEYLHRYSTKFGCLMGAERSFRPNYVLITEVRLTYPKTGSNHIKVLCSSINSITHSSGLPPHLPNPTCPLDHILPLHQQFHTIQLLRQLLITRNLVDERMTSPTQPRHFRQLPLRMPPPLNSLRMHLPWDQMVVSQRQLLPVAYFTAIRARSGQRGGVFGWGGSGGREVDV